LLSEDGLIGLTVHVLEPTQALRTTSDFAAAVTLKRGDVIQLTEEDVEASKNRFGESSWAIVDDPELQELRFGKQVFGIGPWPEGLPVFRTPDEDPAYWASTKYVSTSNTIAAYAGTDGQRPSIRPSLRNSW